MRKALQQNLIRRFQVSPESAYSVTLGPLWATLIHTSALTFRLRRTLSLFRHDLRPSDSSVLSTPPKESPRHNYELDVNGLNYDGARNETSDSRPRAGTLDAEMPVRLTGGRSAVSYSDKARQIRRGRFGSSRDADLAEDRR